ncbi:hypothetical protein B0T22DRAFT_376570 [Podospora appendiculata]|uniref:Uncharacterized protein n=1 Tax=Podospora appendiculata TaxID=314037 RepID=A0AAE1CDS8_9PEZI|nr:hypothetical protein B0T22DRAFT_376570 [Podospora appendiculata]
MLLAGICTCTAAPKYPKAPSLTFLYTVNITAGAAYKLGAGPKGFRTITVIANGTFAGPKLKGTVLPVGADWALTDANHPVNGTLFPDVRQTFLTDDGAYIQIFETGASQPDGTVFVRLTYEASSEKYYWLNAVVAIGIIRPLPPDSLTIDTWQVRLAGDPLSEETWRRADILCRW